MTPYEQIKAEVVKCCPEIMELKLGTEIKYKDKEGIFCTFGNGTLKNPMPMNVILNGTSSIVRGINKYDDDFEILGSPIELHHILRTIPKYGLEVSITAYFLYFEYIEGDNCGKHFGWNLALPLASQSEETLKGLSELLTGNK